MQGAHLSCSPWHPQYSSHRKHSTNTLQMKKQNKTKQNDPSAHCSQRQMILKLSHPSSFPELVYPNPGKQTFEEAEEWNGDKPILWVWNAKVQTPTLPFISWITSGKLFNISEAVLLSVKDETYFLGWLWRSDKFNWDEMLRQALDI